MTWEIKLSQYADDTTAFVSDTKYMQQIGSKEETSNLETSAPAGRFTVP